MWGIFFQICKLGIKKRERKDGVFIRLSEENSLVFSLWILARIYRRALSIRVSLPLPISLDCKRQDYKYGFNVFNRTWNLLVQSPGDWTEILKKSGHLIFELYNKILHDLFVFDLLIRGIINYYCYLKLPNLHQHWSNWNSIKIQWAQESVHLIEHRIQNRYFNSSVCEGYYFALIYRNRPGRGQ